MKKLLGLSIFIISTSISAQSLKDFSTPKGYEKITEARGDLDKDGKEETVVIFNITTKSISEDREDFPRIFYILKSTDGKQKIWQENSIFLFSSGTGFYPESNAAPEITIKNNSFSIKQVFNTNSRHTQTYKHTFRFQNGDFYLIGSHSRFEDTCDFNDLNEINFSTGKVIVDHQYSSCEEDERDTPKDYHKEFVHQFKPLIKMNSFRIGENKFKIPDSDKYLYY
ncbi:hypothetical protein ACKW6Q_08590 [Chryseobacterium kwangjuense]|uniref:VCBS repeat-containing protein n=1 Tax=Chryseobacterium kwangjuense TaxID=267125 RepID=A0ABW9K3A9_9FLAO